MKNAPGRTVQIFHLIYPEQPTEIIESFNLSFEIDYIFCSFLYICHIFCHFLYIWTSFCILYFSIYFF